MSRHSFAFDSIEDARSSRPSQYDIALAPPAAPVPVTAVVAAGGAACGAACGAGACRTPGSDASDWGIASEPPLDCTLTVLALAGAASRDGDGSPPHPAATITTNAIARMRTHFVIVFLRRASDRALAD
jgi:hypothetical protein